MNFIQKIPRSVNYLRPITHYRQMLSHYSIDIYEPNYLDTMKPKIPLCDTLNIEMKGYDYPLLENYQKFLHRICKNMDINVEDAWALPHQDFNVSTYKPSSEIVENLYKLKLYRRTIQITDISTIELPILLRAVEACIPAGVTVNVVQHTEDHEQDRYIPDQELNTLKQTLDDLGGPIVKKKGH